jgi:hypothetical protein
VSATNSDLSKLPFPDVAKGFYYAVGSGNTVMASMTIYTAAMRIR